MASQSARQFLSSIPLGTFLSLLTCVSAQVGVYVFGMDLGQYTILPEAVVYKSEWHRLVTSAFFHGGLVHIGFNMLSLLTLGPAVEKIFGTFRFVLYILLCAVLSNFLYVVVCLAAAFLLHDPSWLYYNSVGYSGLLFAFASIESFLSLSPTRNFFGCEVPSRYYPFVMLFGIQIMMPNISFLGHLCGLLFGIFYVFGMLEVFLPSLAYISEFEARHLGQGRQDQSLLGSIVRHPRYCSCPSSSSLLSPPLVVQNCSTFCRNTCVRAVSAVYGLFNNATRAIEQNGRRIRRRENRQGYAVVPTIEDEDEDSDLDSGVVESKV